MDKVMCFCKAGRWSYVRKLNLNIGDDGTIACWQGPFIFKTQICGTTLYFLEYSIAQLRIQVSSPITNHLLDFDQMRYSVEATATVLNLLVVSMVLCTGYLMGSCHFDMQLGTKRLGYSVKLNMPKAAGRCKRRAPEIRTS